MFVVIMPQDKEMHIVSYRLGNGSYRTICAKTFPRNMKTNTLAADDTFPGLCSYCKAYYDEMYHADLNHFPEMARNEGQWKWFGIVRFNRSNEQGPKAKYEEVLEYKIWRKLGKYRIIYKDRYKKK